MHVRVFAIKASIASKDDWLDWNVFRCLSKQLHTMQASFTIIHEVADTQIIHLPHGFLHCRAQSLITCRFKSQMLDAVWRANYLSNRKPISLILNDGVSNVGMSIQELGSDYLILSIDYFAFHDILGDFYDFSIINENVFP